MITHLSTQDTSTHNGPSPDRADSFRHDDRTPEYCLLKSSSQRLQAQLSISPHQRGKLHVRDNKGFLRKWSVPQRPRRNVRRKVWKVNGIRSLFKNNANDILDMVLVLKASCAQIAIVAKDVHFILLYAGTIGTVSGRHFNWRSWQPVRELMVSCFIAGDWSFRKCSI